MEYPIIKENYVQWSTTVLADEEKITYLVFLATTNQEKIRLYDKHRQVKKVRVRLLWESGLRCSA